MNRYFFRRQRIRLGYTDAHVFVLRIRVSCASSMHCTHARFKVRWKRELTHINARQDHEYYYYMVSFSALTNQIAYFEKTILKLVDSVIGKSNLNFEICYIILRKTILFLTSIFYFALKFYPSSNEWLCSNTLQCGSALLRKDKRWFALINQLDRLVDR